MIYKLKNIEDIFSDYNKAFEDLATHMFMKMLKLQMPPQRRTNQKGIEADPVKIKHTISVNDKLTEGIYTYQAKYYQDSTEIKDRKNDFIEAIKSAEEAGANNLMLFVNKELKQNSQSGTPPRGETDIVDYAKSKNITLHWVTVDRIELMLNKKEYWSIRDLFLNTKKHISTYYEDIYTALACEPENALLGGYTLLESYIEPIIDSKEAGNADIE